MAKVWMITGASSGLGEALANAVLQRGDSVVATFRKKEQADTFSQKAGANGLAILLDVTDEGSLKTSVQQAVDGFGKIDVLVNNAGYGVIGAAEECSMDEIRAQFDTNFFAAVALTKEVLPRMRQAGSGHILQMSSVAGFRASAGFGTYNSSKFALEGFSEALAQEVAPFGIRVVLVEPGPFRTKFAGGSIKAAQRRMEAYTKTPVGQMYQYIARTDGTQEGDPAKAAQAMIDYVYNGNKELRLPLGKIAVQGIRAKLAAVEADVKANEQTALNTAMDK